MRGTISLPGAFFIRAITPFTRWSSQDPITHPPGPSLTTITLGLRLQHRNYGQDTHVQTAGPRGASLTCAQHPWFIDKTTGFSLPVALCRDLRRRLLWSGYGVDGPSHRSSVSYWLWYWTCLVLGGVAHLDWADGFPFLGYFVVNSQTRDFYQNV